MNREEILQTIRSLVSSKNFYTRLYQFISDGSEDAEEFLDMLVEKNFKNVVDLILYFET